MFPSRFLCYVVYNKGGPLVSQNPIQALLPLIGEARTIHEFKLFWYMERCIVYKVHQNKVNFFFIFAIL